MNELSTFHETAMDLANQAEVARRKGEEKLSIDLFTQAYKMERDAAALLETNLAAEPTRSVLYRSAASLALDCGQHREAERLIAVAVETIGEI